MCIGGEKKRLVATIYVEGSVFLDGTLSGS